MYFLDVSKAKEKELAPGVRARLLWGDKIMLSFLDMGAGASVPLHSHPHEQMGIVLEGEFEFTIAGETRVVKEGDVYLVPGGVVHGARVLDRPARALDIFHPPREEYKT